MVCAICLTTPGCGRNYASVPPAQVCASADTLARIRRATFDAAAAEASSQIRYALDSLGKQTETRLANPIVESHDRDTGKTSCAATLEVWLPPGVTSERELHGPIRYVSQPTADNKGVVFSVTGMEPLAAEIAGANLGSWAQTNAPQKPGLVVEVVQRGGEQPQVAPIQIARTQTIAPERRLSVTAPSAPTRTPVRPVQVHPSPPTPQVFQPRSAPPAPILPSPPTRLAAPVPAQEPIRPAIPTYTGGPARVFVHIADPSQLPAAEEIRSDLGALSVGGAPIGTPPVRIVSSTPGRTEVRCLKHADCQTARRVAAYLARDLGAPIAVVDMSTTYEHDPGVRSGSLEFWLSRRAGGGD